MEGRDTRALLKCLSMGNGGREKWNSEQGGEENYAVEAIISSPLTAPFERCESIVKTT